MARASDIVTDRLRSVPTKKDGARRPNVPHHRLGLLDRQFHMFRRQPVDDRWCILHRRNHDYRAEIPPAGTRNGPPGQHRQPPLHRRLHGVGKPAVVGYKYRLRRRIVLRLRQKVERDPVWIARTVRHHENLARARDQVDPDGAEHLTLRFRHIRVAGPHDLVDRGDGFGPVGQRTHGLGTADAVDLLDAGQFGGDQYER